MKQFVWVLVFSILMITGCEDTSDLPKPKNIAGNWKLTLVQNENTCSFKVGKTDSLTIFITQTEDKFEIQDSTGFLSGNGSISSGIWMTISGKRPYGQYQWEYVFTGTTDGTTLSGEYRFAVTEKPVYSKCLGSFDITGKRF